MNTSQSQAFTERLDEILHKLGDNGWHDNKGARVDCKSCKKLDQAKDQILALVADEIIGEDECGTVVTLKDGTPIRSNAFMRDELRATQRKKLGI